ncbi:MAG: hypothetical protein RIT45_1621 [Pseudomonadota bacterium]|jgi:beta-lactamase superfamily II metal-dependent hydrolase
MGESRRDSLEQVRAGRRLRAWSWLLLLAWLVTSCGTEPTPGASSDVALPSEDAGAQDAVDAGTDAGAADTGPDADAAISIDPLVPPASGYAAIFLDVGQGDATLIVASTGETLLIDGGVSSSLLGKRLARLGVTRIDMIVATHADADHITGLADVLADYEVGTIVWNGVKKGTQIFDDFLAAANAEPGAKVLIGRRGDTLTLGNLTLEVLHPGSGADTSDDHNNQSVVLQTGCAGAWLLMPGDAEAPAETEMIGANVLSDVDVLHVAHHGSSSGTGTALLAKVQPEVAVISAGAENAYGHPDADVIERLEGVGATIWRTDVGWDDDSLWMHADCKGGLQFGRVP